MSRKLSILKTYSVQKLKGILRTEETASKEKLIYSILIAFLKKKDAMYSSVTDKEHSRCVFKE